MMSSEIATYLTGRYVSFRIYTLSFQEYLEFKKQYTQVKDIHAELADYIRLGGFPATHLREYSQDEVYTIVRDIYNSTIFSDIVKRNQIRKIDQLERVVRYTFANVGNSFSAKSISNYLKSVNHAIDNETVYSYLEKLEKAYLLHRCSRYDLRGKEILKTQEKFYLADTALRYSVLGYTPDSVASSLENVVYLELCRRGYTVTIGKTPDGEVDLWRRSKMTGCMCRSRRRSNPRRQKNVNMNDCWKSGITIRSIFREPMNLPEAITKALRVCTLQIFY